MSIRQCLPEMQSKKHKLSRFCGPPCSLQRVAVSYRNGHGCTGVTCRLGA